MAKKKAKKTKKAGKPKKESASPRKGRHLVKRHGHIEDYDKTKIYASVYAAALSSHMGERESEKLASDVTNRVHKKLARKQMVLSIEIRNIIIDELGGIENDVAFMYVHHLDIN